MTDPRKVKSSTRVTLVHALVHAEAYAMDLSWDIVARCGPPCIPCVYGPPIRRRIVVCIPIRRAHWAYFFAGSGRAAPRPWVAAAAARERRR